MNVTSTFLIALIVAIALSPTACRTADDADTPLRRTAQTDTTRLAQLYGEIQTGYDSLAARYGRMQGRMTPEMQRLHAGMTQMHEGAMQTYRQMGAGGMHDGMMGRRMNGGMGMGAGMGMHGMREWNEQMAAMHETMARMYGEAGFADMATMHEHMTQLYRQALDETPADASPTAPTTTDGDAPDGRTLFAQTCATCHGSDGRGMAGVFPPLAGSAWVTSAAQKPIRIVLHGLQGDVAVAGSHYNGVMPSFQARLTDEQIASILTYVRASWGNDAPAVSSDTVETVREQYEGRTRPWSPSDVQ